MLRPTGWLTSTCGKTGKHSRLFPFHWVGSDGQCKWNAWLQSDALSRADESSTVGKKIEFSACNVMWRIRPCYLPQGQSMSNSWLAPLQGKSRKTRVRGSRGAHGEAWGTLGILGEVLPPGVGDTALLFIQSPKGPPWPSCRPKREESGKVASRREERMQAGLSEALLLLILQSSSASPKDPLVLSKLQGSQLNSYLLFLWEPHSR